MPQPAGHLVGRVLLENGEAAGDAEVFFKVQKAFGASCYSKECDSFQNAIFRRRLTVSADGSFQIRIPGRYMNPSEKHKAYVYTVIVRTSEGRFRPFYAFEIGHDERIVNEFVLKPPFLDTLPGGEDDLGAVRPDTDEVEVRALTEMARKYRCICVTTLPSYTPLIKELLADEPEIRIKSESLPG